MFEVLTNENLDILLTSKRRNQHTKPKAAAGMKICCRCEKEQPLSEFTKNKAKVDGLDARCKTCKKEIREENREYHAAKSKEWRENNPDRFKERRDAWSQANPQSQNETRKKWLADNKHKVRQIKQAYKLRRKEWEVGDVDYDEILARDGLVCHICGLDVAPDDIHFDHVIPLSKEGMHSMDNIHVSHSKCNLKKNNKLMEELAEKVTATIQVS
jgi:5-methylcytosine-specific restriction endonuclease McrA